jgi:hypothetical protein
MRVEGREEVSMEYEGRRNEEKAILRARERELLKERDNERQKQGKKGDRRGRREVETEK